jgi:hypothetical protein
MRPAASAVRRAVALVLAALVLAALVLAALGSAALELAGTDSVARLAREPQRPAARRWAASR